MPVSLKPSDTIDPLVELSAGEVIRKLHIDEAKRRRDDDDYNQADVPVSFRSVPEGLLEALDEVTSSTGMRKAVITKCLSRHAMVWYQSMPGVSLLSSRYKTVQTLSDGYPDIIRRVKRDDYEFVSARPVSRRMGTLRTVSFVLGYFGETGDALGIPSYKMLLAGLCWSISTNLEGWSSNTVRKFLLPESENMQTYLGERLLALDYADRVIRLRRKDPAVLEYVKCLSDESKKRMPRGVQKR